MRRTPSLPARGDALVLASRLRTAALQLPADADARVDLSRMEARLGRRRLAGAFTELLACVPVILGGVRLFSPHRSAALLLLALAVGLLTHLCTNLSGDRWGGTPTHLPRRAARRLIRRWRARPAGYLTRREFADAGLHAKVAAALGDAAHVDTAAELLAGGFAGSLGELLAATRGVLAAPPIVR